VYLKRLDVQGFKSFASRTTFEFGQGITAIVGPNGSGKSNIADALRWVLGEQSGRLLRAKKLDDIIFAGSSTRARSDRVEVTLTLDNSDGWLPVDVPEVAAARRGFRSGESDYIINKKKVRLREIQSLLTKASASQSSYAIIGQGLVESVLNLRPEERRLLIEEAADIQRYRLKIEEAQDRLKATHENVERVRLLMKEIAPRLAQLERQAKRAGEHARLSTELRQALQTFYEHQWHRAQESLAVARANHDQANAEFVQAKVALETCQRELSDIAKQLEEHRQRAAATAAQREGLDQRIRDLERRLAVSRERRAILEERSQELEEELRVLEEERQRTSGVVEAEEETRVELEVSLQEAKQALAARQADVTALEQEFRDALTHGADAEAKSKRLQGVAAEMKGRIRKLTDGQRDLEREASRLDTRRRSLVSQMAEQLRVLRSLRGQEAELMEQVSTTMGNRESLETELRQIMQTLSKLEGDQNERRGKLQGLEARLDVLEEAQKQAQASSPDAAITVEGALSTVYEIIRVPRGLEDAIAAALTGQLEAFVFDRQAQAISAIQSLVAEGGPRTAVLPMDTIKSVYPLNIMKEKGVVGVAARLVKYPSRYEKLVNNLLGRTVVVQDVTAAARVMRRGLGTVVTLDGILFHPSGYISGGQPQTSRPFILGYERDLEVIPKEMDRIRRSLGVAEREVESLRERRRQAESALAALTKDAESALDKRRKMQDSLSQRQQKLAQLRGEMRGLIGSQGSLRDQQRALAVEAERLENERTSLLEEARESAETAKYVGQANGVIQQRRRVLTDAVEEAANALGGVDARYRSLAAQREAAEVALGRLEAQITAKAAHLRGLEMELTTLSSSVEADEKGLGEARKQMESFAQGAQPGEEGSHHLEARQRDLHSQVMSSQNRLFESERQALEAEAEVRRWQTEVDTLKVRIDEDGLTLSADGNILVQEAEEVTVPFWLAAGEDGPDEGEESSWEGRPISGGAHIDQEGLRGHIERLRAQIRGLGPVNVEAREDYESLSERHSFLAGQLEDLATAEKSLHRAINELTTLMRKRFETTFEKVARGFEQYFKAFFGGGQAELSLTDPNDPSNSGVEIEAQPPGKKTKTLTQLSGGEKALTSVSLLFALLHANPSPFCVLDEVDAMLDEANVGRFASSLRELAQRTQFIVITHNRRTIEVADSIYGVSMAPDGASRVLSMRLGDLPAGQAVAPN
jgi:chromosome segregation protein